jgi:hypothetical protein
MGLASCEGSRLMRPFGPIKKEDLVRYFAQLGFEGPYSGGKHQFMVKGDFSIG